MKNPTDPTPEKLALIERIVFAARRSCSTIVEVFHLMCDDGQLRSPWGIPTGVKTTGQRQSVGFAFQDKDGTTYGRRGESREEMEAAHREGQDQQAADFRAELLKMTAESFADQVAYWLKE